MVLKYDITGKSTDFNILLEEALLCFLGYEHDKACKHVTVDAKLNVLQVSKVKALIMQN